MGAEAAAGFWDGSRFRTKYIADIVLDNESLPKPVAGPVQFTNIDDDGANEWVPVEFVEPPDELVEDVLAAWSI